MRFQVDPGLYDGVSPAREREWRTTLAELNMDFSKGPADDRTLTLHRREDGGVDVRVEGAAIEPVLVPLPAALLRRHFRDYRQVIEQIARSGTGGFGARDFETLDYAKKLCHDDAGETLQEAFHEVVPLAHPLARKLFTLVFLVSHSLPESLVTRHRHREP